uniref:Uncharacterized protein n=1 Tax=Anguilla anguilla TaxID=7936 RepID=A0A0E9T6Q8_ANGAN
MSLHIERYNKTDGTKKNKLVY